MERLYADIDFELNGIVSGVLYCISERDLQTLDTYEGCPRIYRRIWVEVECEGETYLAATYQMTAETKVLRAGMPYPEDYRRICSNGANYHHIPNNFISRKLFFKLKRSSK